MFDALLWLQILLAIVSFSLSEPATGCARQGVLGCKAMLCGDRAMQRGGVGRVRHEKLGNQSYEMFVGTYDCGQQA